MNKEIIMLMRTNISIEQSIEQGKNLLIQGDVG